MTKRKVLFIAHNHPSVRPGGAESYALELYEAMKASPGFEPILLAKGGPPISNTRKPHEGTLLGAVNGDPNQYFLYTEGFDFDWFHGTARVKDLYVKFFREFLTAYKPDVVHFQHTLHLGYDMIREVRNTLPDAPILYTLHEYLPICHRNGQMLRTNDEDHCIEESPRRCHECFPDISPQAFFMRKRFIQSHLSLVDRFLAPSRFLMQRYLDWGIPAAKIEFEDYGRSDFPAVAAAENGRPRNRIAFFGQLTFFKGVLVLLRAMQLLDQDAKMSRRNPAHGTASRADCIHLSIHGANLELQTGSFQTEFRTLLETAKQNVTFAGRYEPREIGRLMADADWVVIPSIWWENAPLVIQEAFIHKRPVICSDIGGMAEKVTDEVNGLHFRAGDPQSLASTIRRAATTPGLWERLCEGIPDIYRIEDSVTKLTGIYDALLAKFHSRKR